MAVCVRRSWPWVRVSRSAGGALGRAASVGLVAMLVTLPGFAFWGALTNYETGEITRRAIRQSQALQEARFEGGAEESLERKYRLEPGPDVAARHREAAAQLEAALRFARALADPAEAARIDDILALHARYLAATARMFAAVDAGDIPLSERVDAEEGDPAYDAIEAQLLPMAEMHRARALESLRSIAGLQLRVLFATPVVFGFGLGLVIFFARVLRSFRVQARDAQAREGLVLAHSEQRLRSLVQNAADLILICRRDRAITYQSPAAEAAWGYRAGALLGETSPSSSMTRTRTPPSRSGARCLRRRVAPIRWRCGSAPRRVSGAIAS
jgi:PAS domain-containing protein